MFVYNAAGAGAGASVAFAGPIAGLAAAFGAGLGAAGLAAVGQANGSGNPGEAALLERRLLLTSIASGLVAALLLALAGSAFLAPLDRELRADSAAYLALSALALPLQYFAHAYTAIASARGRTDKPFWRALAGFGAKAAFDALFVLVLGGGARGAGWAGLAASGVVAVFMVLDLSRMRRDAGGMRPGRRSAPPEPAVVATFLVLALPAALTQASTSLSFILMNAQAASYGSDALNGFTIANTVNSLFFAPAAAIGQAVAAMVALSSGAGRPDRCDAAARTGLRLGFAFSLALALFLVPSAAFLSGLFTRDPGVLVHATDAMRVFSVSIIGFAVLNIVSGAFAGTGRTGMSFRIAVLRIWVLRVPVAWLIARLWPGIGAYSVWLSMGVSNFGTAAVSLAWLRGIDWEHRALGRAA